jgi:AMP phosphorylase
LYKRVINGFYFKIITLEAGGKYIVVMCSSDAKQLGLISSDRVEVTVREKLTIAILNTSSEFPEGTLGVFKEVKSRLDIDEGDIVQVEPVDKLESLGFIREKIFGQKLTSYKINMIVKDVVERHLSDIELTSFVTSLQYHGTSMEEVEALSRSMINSGRTIDFGKPNILDKHSIGGVPGDKTTLLVVPIVAAAGYTIPKTSSRAITSPAGTADRMEALAPVDLRFDEIREAVEETDACIVWGGALDLAPADDIFIQVEYPLAIDPLLLPSIMSKKKAMGSTHVVIDIPTGRGAKIKTIGEAQQLAFDFIELGNRLGMHIRCAVTEGMQPVGYSMGPRLATREALETLMGRGSRDLVDKATSLAGVLFEMMGSENGKELALSLLSSGKAEEKMRQIINAQGGDPEVRPEDLVLGDKVLDIKATNKGRVLWINNRSLVQIARAMGTPNDLGAGLLLNVKLGDNVKVGDVLVRIFSENNRKLSQAEDLVNRLVPIGVGDKIGEKMLITQITEETEREKIEYILDR